MPTDAEIARAASPRPIHEIAAQLGLEAADLQPYGHDVAKIDLSLLVPRMFIGVGESVLTPSSMCHAPHPAQSFSRSASCC